MKKITTGVIASMIGVSGLMAAAAPSLAAAASVDWGHTLTGTYGATVEVNGTCGTGTGCERTKVVTGVQGNAWTRAGSVASNGEGGYNASLSFTGPRGNSVTFKNY